MSPVPTTSPHPVGRAERRPAPRPSTRRLVAAAAVVAVAVHLWGLYRDHGPPAVGWLPYADKLEHLVGFALPCFLVLLALRVRAAAAGRRPGRRAVVVVVVLFAAHAVVSEVVQGTLSTTRTGDPADALADLLGTALGLVAFLATSPGRGAGGRG